MSRLIRFSVNMVCYGLNELHAYFLCRETADTRSTSWSLQNLHSFMRCNLVWGEKVLLNTIGMQSVIKFTTVRCSGVWRVSNHWVRNNVVWVFFPFQGFCEIKWAWGIFEYLRKYAKTKCSTKVWLHYWLPGGRSDLFLAKRHECLSHRLIILLIGFHQVKSNTSRKSITSDD